MMIPERSGVPPPAVYVFNFTHAESVMAEVASKDVEYGTVTTWFVPMKLKEQPSPEGVSVDHVGAGEERFPVFPLPDRSIAIVLGEQSSKSQTPTA
jgi:hypothetical protein